MNNTILEVGAIENQLGKIEVEKTLQDLSDLQLAMVGGGIADVIAG